MVIAFVNPAASTNQQRGDELFIRLFFSPDGFAAPQPLYRQLQDEVGVHLSGFGGALLTRYDDCRAILRDQRFGQGDGMPDGAFGGADTPELALRRKLQAERAASGRISMLGLDPPAHTRQRSLVSRAFTPRRIEALRPRISELVEGCLDEVEAQGRDGTPVDLMETLARPLPVSVISEMLGVPRTDWPLIRDHVTDLVTILEPAAPLDVLQRAEAASDALWAYFIELLAERRRQPSEDLLSGLAAAADGTDQLTDNEILALAILLFAAGSETTTNLIGNGVHQLLKHPDEMERLWANPELVPSAVEEILRFDSPVQLDGRACLEPAEFAGLRFEEGDRVITLLGAANHDPLRFPDPDRFDIARYAPPELGGPNESAAEPVMSFGSGIHYCLGANLARLEGAEVMAGLIRRFSAIGDSGPREYRNALVLRGLTSCPVTVTPR